MYKEPETYYEITDDMVSVGFVIVENKEEEDETSETAKEYIEALEFDKDEDED